MSDAETTALLRAVLDEVCENVSRYETGARAHVASKILEAATKVVRIPGGRLGPAPHEQQYAERCAAAARLFRGGGQRIGFPGDRIDPAQ